VLFCFFFFYKIYDILQNNLPVLVRVRVSDPHSIGALDLDPEKVKRP
jgi:hypothetical protein